MIEHGPNTDEGLVRLIGVMATITGAKGVNDASTLSDIGFDSTHLVDLMLACDDIYGSEIQFEAIEFSVEMTVLQLHRQIIAMPPERL